MSGVLEIDVGEMPTRFALVDNVFGKCLDDFEMRCPTELKEAFARNARECGQSAAWRVRFWMAIDAYGVEEVVSLIAKGLPVAGPQAKPIARAMVQAMLDPLVQGLEVPAHMARRSTDVLHPSQLQS